MLPISPLFHVYFNNTGFAIDKNKKRIKELLWKNDSQSQIRDGQIDFLSQSGMQIICRYGISGPFDSAQDPLCMIFIHINYSSGLNIHI